MIAVELARQADQEKGAKRKQKKKPAVKPAESILTDQEGKALKQREAAIRREHREHLERHLTHAK